MANYVAWGLVIAIFGFLTIPLIVHVINEWVHPSPVYCRSCAYYDGKGKCQQANRRMINTFETATLAFDERDASVVNAHNDCKDCYISYSGGCD